jgi:hemerythrin-like metal-binding protein
VQPFTFIGEPPIRLKMNTEKIIKLFLVIAGIVCLGTFGFSVIEGWSLFDSLYMTIITITTVGYGETHDLTMPGRLFTIFLIFLGIGVVAVIGSEFAKMLIENQLESILGRRKMSKELNSLEGHYIICGFGRMGGALAEQLEEYQIPFCVIEKDEERVRVATSKKYPCLIGQPTDDNTLLMAGVQRAKGILIILPDDNDNLLVTLAAREFNPEIQILTRCDQDTIRHRIKTAGANKIVNPLKMGGQQIATLVAQQEKIEVQDRNLTSTIDVQGMYLTTYRHFSRDEATVGEVIDKMEAMDAVKIEQKNGFVLSNPNRDQVVNHEDLIVLVMETGRESKRELSNLKWSEEFSVDDQSIDEEHLQLISLINELQMTIVEDQDQETINHIFDRLIKYTIVHFDNEEKMLKEAGYPDLKEHAREHKKLKAQVQKLSREKNFLLSSNIAEFLQVWLKDHILGSDKKYAEYFKEKRKVA